MARLFMIEGPQRGESCYLGNESFLGWDGAQICVTPQHDHSTTLCMIRGGGSRFELMTSGSPQSVEHVRVNGESVRQVELRDGDLIKILDSLMYFQTDNNSSASDSGPFTHGHQPVQAPQHQPSDSVRIGGIQPGEASDMMLGTVSIRREDLAKENINYRQKHYEDEKAVLRGIGDARRIETLYKVSHKISAILDLEDLLNEVLEIVFEEIPADRGSILLFDQNRRRLRTMASRSRAGGNAKVKISKTIVKEVLRTKDSLLTADAQADARLDIDMARSIVDEDIHSALCVPLVRGEKILGIVFLDTYDATRQFSKDDCDLLTAIAMQASVALENARLIKEMGDRERMRHELHLSSSIQRQLLPKKLPRSDMIEVFGKMIPAKEMSGDYFDFIDHGAQGNFHICVGDVSGKGLPAGLVMVMARSYLRPLTKSGMAPSEILAEANRLLYADTRRDVFMSALVMHWSDETGRFVWSGAGHEHLIVYRNATRRTEAIKAGGCVLGAIPEAAQAYHNHELFLNPGDALVLYTDGVTEAKNPQGEFFAQDSLEPVQRLVELYGQFSAKELLEAILYELKRFINGAEQSDDITVVTIKRREA